LDGLVATEEHTFTYNKPPIVKHTEEFSFKSISMKKRGIFIIDFVGSGISSRAIIRKGKLILKEKLTADGHVF
jgi:hypothetical protein